MGVPAQRRDLLYLWKIFLEIEEEAAGGNSIAVYGAGFEGSGESLNMRLENLNDRGVEQRRARVVFSAARETELWLE
jgi:hypothetical protein